MASQRQEAKGVWNSGTSFTAVLPNAPADGNALILTVHISKNTLTPVTVTSVTSTGATWAKAVNQTNNDGVAAAVDAEVWSAPGISSAGATVTINLSGTPYGAVAFLSEWVGVQAVAPSDQTASNSGVSQTPDSGTTATTTSSDEIAIAALSSVSLIAFNGTPTNGFASVDTQLELGLAAEYCSRILEDVEAVGTSDSTDLFSSIWAGCVATFIATQVFQPSQFSGIYDVIDSQQVPPPRTDLSVIPPLAAILPPTGQMVAPAAYSGIEQVSAYNQTKFTCEIRTRLSVPPNPIPILPPALLPLSPILVPSLQVLVQTLGPIQGTSGTFSQTPTNGNTIILVAGSRNGNSVSSITQTGVTWTRLLSEATGNVVEIWKGVIGFGASTSISIAWSVGPDTPIFIAREYAITSVSVDKTATNSADTQFPDTGTTASTTTATELLIGGTFVSGFGDQTQTNPTHGFTLLGGTSFGGGGGVGRSLAFLEKLVTATGAANSGTTLPGIPADSWVGAIVTLTYTQTAPVYVPSGQYTGGNPPQQYSGISRILAFLELDRRANWPRRLTVNPPVVWTYSFTVSDTGTGVDAAFTGPLVADSGHGADAVGLTAQLTVGDVGRGADTQSTRATLIVQDAGHGVDAVLLPAKAGKVGVMVGGRTVAVKVGGRAIAIVNAQRTVKVLVEPD